jgi:site-specific DNA recombinase
MTPTYACKGSKRYRYYVCSHALKRGWDSCPSQSVPAGAMEWTVMEQISKLAQDPGRLKEILKEASKQRSTRLADLETERHRLNRELEILTESSPSRNGEGVEPAAGDVIHESIGHLKRRLNENQRQVLVLQQPVLDVEQATEALAAWGHVFGSWPAADQVRCIRSAVKRADYDGREGRLALMLDSVGLASVLEEQANLAMEITK